MRQVKRSVSEVLLDALRAFTVGIWGSGVSTRRFPEAIIPISPDPVIIDEGKEVIWDRRALPGRKYISVGCSCGYHTRCFTILRNWQYFLREKEALAWHFKYLEPTLRVATIWNQICLSGKCMECDRVIEAYIRFDH